MIYKGEPLLKGAIQFIDEGKEPCPGGRGEIVAGKYAVETKGLASGTYQVRIFGFEKTGKILRVEGSGGMVNGKAVEQVATEVPEERQFLPAQFNSRTTLRAELNPGENLNDFTLVEKTFP